MSGTLDLLIKYYPDYLIILLWFPLDIPLVPSISGQGNPGHRSNSDPTNAGGAGGDSSGKNKHNFVLHWMNNKEMEFTGQFKLTFFVKLEWKLAFFDKFSFLALFKYAKNQFWPCFSMQKINFGPKLVCKNLIFANFDNFFREIYSSSWKNHGGYVENGFRTRRYVRRSIRIWINSSGPNSKHCIKSHHLGSW